MPKVKLSSNVLMSLFAVLATTALACGGSGNSNSDGSTDAGTDGKPDGAVAGKGGAAGGGGGIGGSVGGKGGGGAVGTGGGTAGGGASGAGTGGKGTGGSAGNGIGGGGATGNAGKGGGGNGSGGTAGGGTAGGGTAGGGTAGGGTAGGGTAGIGGVGGGSVCVTPPVCTLNAFQCVTSGPQKCLADSKGCPNWAALPACGAHQTCNATTGACDCVNDAACTAREGSFCPTQGATTFSQCTKDANGCYTVTGGAMACTAPQICTVTGVVTTGTACGCPTNGSTLGTGCGDKNVGDATASPTDNAVLVCQTAGACKTWKIQVNCADQSMTAGTVSGLPVCVCKAAGSAPGDSHSLYVDPNPPLAQGMNGAPTGVLQPPACRFKAISDALTPAAITGSPFTRIVAIHETAGTATFANEPTPLVIPAGVTVTTADGPSFNTDHYVISLSGAQSLARITLGNGTSLSGFKIDGTAAGGSQVLVTNSGLAGAIDLHNLSIVSPGGTGTIGIQITGAVSASANTVALSGAEVGIDLVNGGGAPSLSTLTGTAITSASTLFGARVGTNASLILSTSALTVSNGGTGIGDSGSVNLTGVTVQVTGTGGAQKGIALGGTGSLTTSGGSVTVAQGGGLGLDVGLGTATLSATPITVAGLSNAVSLGTTGTLSATGSVINTGASSTGLLLAGGTAAVIGGSVTTGDSSIGVSAAGTTLSLAGTTIKVGATSFGLSESAGAKVTIAGTGTANSTFTTSPTAGSTDGDGITVNGPTSTLTINGNTAISKFRNGVVVNDGTVDVSGGNVIVSGNNGDGAQFANQTPNVNSHVIVTSGTFQNNNGSGVVVDSTVFTKLVTSTISGNSADGVQVQAIPPSGTAAFLFDIEGSTLSANKGRGIAITGVGQVGANIQGNTISGNTLSGVLVSTGSNQSVDVALLDNDISANLTSAADSTIIGGGVFFSQVPTAGAMNIPAPTGVMLTKFSGNKVHGNVRNQIAFDFPQRGTTAWDLSSSPGNVDMTTVCQDAAKPNSVYCYLSGNSLGVAVAGGASATIKGMHFQSINPTAGVDFSSTGVIASVSCPPILTCP